MSKIFNKNNFERKPSSHKEFFQRIYGNLEKSNVTFYHNDDNNKIIKNIDLSLCHEKNKNFNQFNYKLLLPKAELKIQYEVPLYKESIFIPYYDFQFHHQTMQFSTRTFSEMSLESCTSNFSALHRKKRKDSKIRRQRTTFTREQTLHLENEFRINEYIPRNRRNALALYLNLTQMQIKIWFQNRRAKDKRIEKAQLDQIYRNMILSQMYFLPSSW